MTEQIFYLPEYDIFCVVSGEKVDFALTDSTVIEKLASHVSYFGDCMSLVTDFIWICAL